MKDTRAFNPHDVTARITTEGFLSHHEVSAPAEAESTQSDKTDGTAVFHTFQFHFQQVSPFNISPVLIWSVRSVRKA